MGETSENVWNGQVERDTDTVSEIGEDIAYFVEEHNIDSDGQHKCLVEELGELSEALLIDADRPVIAEEIGDVIFVAWTIALLHDIDPVSAVGTVAAENVRKDAGTDGGKVTKSGLESEEHE